MATTIASSAAESLLHPPSSKIITTTAKSQQPPIHPPPYTFSFTPFMRANALASLTSTVPICPAFAAGNCPLGRRCPDRHPTPTQQHGGGHHYGRGNDNFVCKHWLKGLCKKGDACDYLHEYNLRKMSECQFYNQNGYCQNGDECLYVHVKEDSKLPLCEDYDSGFCAKGPRCGKRHVRRKLCPFYLAGFCPDGRDCGFGVHLKGAEAGEGKANSGQDEHDRTRKERATEMDKRDDEGKREFGWKGGRGGRGGRWKNKRDRKGQS